jgi:FHS family L-fucose permease-like MFS transporter
LVIEKIGYKKTMVVGLLIMAVGALLFVPAANVPPLGSFWRRSSCWLRA